MKRADRDDESGFSLIEVIAASAILLIIVVSLSNMVVDSMTTALLTKQRETAASLASDMIENAKGLGQALLANATPQSVTCPVPPLPPVVTTALPNPTIGSAAIPKPFPDLTAANIEQCFTIFVDNRLYEITPTFTPPTTFPVGPEQVKINVSWASGTGTLNYFTYALVGT